MTLLSKYIHVLPSYIGGPVAGEVFNDKNSNSLIHLNDERLQKLYGARTTYHIVTTQEENRTTFFSTEVKMNPFCETAGKWNKKTTVPEKNSDEIFETVMSEYSKYFLI